MSYFNNFPIVLDYRVDNKLYNGIDITRRVTISAEAKNNPAVYMEYSIQDGDTPEIIADRIYDDPGMYWVIMMFNDKFDISTDWPLGQVSFDRYVERKYGKDQMHSIHHFESIASGEWVDEDWVTYDKRPVTNYEYEMAVNEQKRILKVPLPQYATQIVNASKKLIRK